MKRTTTITFPPICTNCRERHDDMTGGDPEGDPGCDWDRMSGNGLGPAPRRFSINTRRRGHIGYEPTADERAVAADMARERLTGGRTSSNYGFSVSA